MGMTKGAYEQALKDWQYLWDIDPAYDMTGGYVDQDDLDALLHNPTKTTAKNCLISQIYYWFEVGTESKGSADNFMSDPIVAEIFERYSTKILKVNRPGIPSSHSACKIPAYTFY
jgi:hypothetical protein